MSVMGPVCRQRKSSARMMGLPLPRVSGARAHKTSMPLVDRSGGWTHLSALVPGQSARAIDTARSRSKIRAEKIDEPYLTDNLRVDSECFIMLLYSWVVVPCLDRRLSVLHNVEPCCAPVRSYPTGGPCPLEKSCSDQSQAEDEF